MTSEIKCKICGATIDRTACDNNYCHITIFADAGEIKYYLCEDCTYSLTYS